MQVDSRNFQEHIDLILHQIESAHFIAFDCEFSGLTTQRSQIEGLFADHQEFYQRIKETALNFNLLQLGITLFQFKNGEYFPRSYNFYTSASPKQNCNKIFLSQWESLAFLARNGMEFDKVFKFGINYKRIQQKQTVQIQQKREQKTEPKTFYSPEDKNLIKKIEQLIKKQTQLRVDFKSKRIFDYFRTTYDMSFDKSKNNQNRYEYNIKIYPQNEIEFIQQKQQKPNTLQNLQIVSLTEKSQHKSPTLEVVISKIIQSGKPIVGHFPSLDLGLIYHSFIDELPQTYQEFTLSINKLFGFIYDTKVISRRLQAKMKSIKVDLKSLFKSCFNKKLLQPYCNINYKFVEDYLKTQSSHEAGYDSFMTGCAFIAMLNYLYDQKQNAFVFALASAQNKILYSKFSGQVSLFGPIYSQKTERYNRRIVIVGGCKEQHDWEKMGESLSDWGTVEAYEDHGQTYYVFDQDQDVAQILEAHNKLKRYQDRYIIQSSSYFK